MAIEDCAILGQCLTEHPVSEALDAYARARRSRVRRVQRAARANGRTYHAGGLTAFVRDAVMRRLGPDGMRQRYAWLYGWTPDA